MLAWFFESRVRAGGELLKIKIGGFRSGFCDVCGVQFWFLPLVSHVLTKCSH